MFKKLLGTILFTCATAFSASAVAQVIGYVHEVKGDVTLRATPGAQPTKAAAGDTFQQGAAVTTGADGNVTLKFEDGQLAVLAPNSQFVATTYVFNKTRVADSNILFSLARGGLRFVSGVIAATNSSKFAVRTPTATAGVRGTDGTVMFADGVTIATTGNGTLVLSVTPPGGGAPIVVSIPPGTTSVASATGVSQPAPTATVAVPPALTALAVTIRAIAAAPVATTNTPVNPTATANAVRAAVALAVAVAQGAPAAQVQQLQAAANTANQAAITQNNVTAAQAAAAGAIQAPPPATPVAPPLPGLTPPPPPVLAPPPPPPVTVVVPSGS